jgi:hypothetical protein
MFGTWPEDRLGCALSKGTATYANYAKTVCETMYAILFGSAYYVYLAVMPRSYPGHLGPFVVTCL